MTEQLQEGVNLSDARHPVDENHPYMVILRQAIEDRPVPAIEKPLGPRAIESPTKPVVLIDNLEGLRNWQGEMSGARPWTG